MADSPLKLADLAGLSAPLTKLIEVLSLGIGTLYADTFRIKRARTQIAADELEAEAARHALVANAMADQIAEDLRAAGTQLLQAGASPVASISPLQDRLLEGMHQRQTRRLSNVVMISAAAIDAMPEDANADPVDDDWTFRFFEHAERVSNPTMQEVWSQVLARQVAKPGVFALKTLDVLSVMTQSEAELFARTLSYRAGDGVLSGCTATECSLTLREIGTLIDLGLLSANQWTYSFDIVKSNNRRFTQIGSHRFELLSGTIGSDPKATITIYPFTRVAQELLQVVQVPKVSPTYRDAIVNSAMVTLKSVESAAQPSTGGD